MSLYTMKEIIEQCETTEDALRYYEKIGLLSAVQRKANGHRIYSPADKERLLLIQCLKKANMSLEEMRPFVALHQSREEAMQPKTEQLLRSYQERIKQQQEHLQQIWDMIEHKLNSGENLAFKPASN